MTVTIVHPQPDLGVASLGVPPAYGYLLVGATVAPPRGVPVVRPDAARDALLQRVSQHLEMAAQQRGVVRATAYRAVVVPPARPPKFRPDLELPRFDVAVLVETESPDLLGELAASEPVSSLLRDLHPAAWRVKEMRARCVKAIADVEKVAGGTYLFNFWAAADRTTALEVFDHLAPWYQAKTGLKNSTVLQPIDDDEFAFVNHARWDAGALSIALKQFVRPSFHRFVRPTLAANDVAVFPALYRKV
jgi:hypothetical protein